MIGLAKERNGVYYFETTSISNIVKEKLPLSFYFSSNKETIWLNHFRFSHPSFDTLKIMFPSLVKKLNSEEFHCDVCEFAKHTRISFSINNKSSHPFNLIHNEV